MKTSLVIMAAGIGSRFGGGIKQLEPVGPNGEIIMDYSIHDAIAAGFNKIIFIIRKDIEADFREVIGDRIEKQAPITVGIETISDKVLRYSGLVGENRRPFDLKYEDYVRAIDGLKEDCYVVKEKKNAKIDDVVRITDIKIIDANSLYQIENRKGVIVDMQTERNKKVVFFVRLDSKNGELGKTLQVERDSFELVDGDTHSLLHIKCASCEM